jgi:flavin-dependent dehydrogenase
VRWFNPRADFARPHALLTGDAAGVDPLFAEGISYAMEYGEVVAEALVGAFRRGDFSFSTYRQHLLEHRLGTLLARRTAVAKGLYNRRYWGPWQVIWRLAAVASPPLQAVIGRWLALLP